MSERLRLTHDGKLLINGVDYLKDEQSVEMYTSTQHSSHMGDEVNTKADPRNCYGASIRTYTGKMFDFENPTADMLDINDIANALAMQPRYTGHIPVFYSVAQHATLMSFKLPTIEEQKMALLHEGFEAYGMDLSSPLKSILPDYRKLEDNVMSIVAEKFGLEYPFPPSIKEADYRMYTTESKFFGRELDYSVLPDPYDDMEIIPWNWKLAKRLFLTRYYELFYGKRYNID